MLEDRYGNTLSTRSAEARDAYVEAVDRFLAALAGVEDAFGAAVAADPDFALAHVGLARWRQVSGDGRGAAQAMARARALADRVTAREAGHLHALGLLVDGNGPGAYKAVRAHLEDHPRDAMVAQTSVGVFGLIGFSGQAGREAEQLAFTSHLAPHYGNDWWFLGQHAFAQVEAGQVAPAKDTIARSLAGHPRNANAAHIKAHVHYEAGETDAGHAYMAPWRDGYGKGGALHCHISWHVAIWALERGERDTMWSIYDADVAPSGAWGPALNVLTDCAAFLYRAHLAGVAVAAERWRAVSAYAAEKFPHPGIAFADVHAALAHAMAGDGDSLGRIIRDAKGPAGPMVAAVAEAFGALARENWADATDRLVPVMAEHERIGGSRAQRDLLEYALAGALLEQGQHREAARWIASRRPNKIPARAVRGL